MADLSGESVLVTGGAGFVGYHLSIKLLRQEARILVYDDLTAERSSIRFKLLKRLGATCFQASVLNYRKLRAVGGRAHVIFHLAAKTSVRESMMKPLEYLQVNGTGTANVLRVASEIGCPVIFTSSSTIYGIASRYPTPEDEPLRPISFYGLSKLIAERCCEEFRDLPTTRLRLFNIYGPEGRGVVFDLLHKLSRNPLVLKVIGSGGQSKDFVYASDVVEALLAAARHPDGECYNVGSGKSYSVSEIVSILLEQLGLLGATRVIYGAEPSWLGDVQFTLADISRISSKLNWKASTDIRRGIAETISWFEREIAPIKRLASRS